MFSKSAFLIAFISICTSTQAQVGISAPPVSSPALAICTNLELQKQVPCPDSALFFHEGKALVQRAFNERQFATLDTLYDQWCSGKDRFPDGRWKLSQYEAALHENFDAWNTWSRDLDAIKSWKSVSPNSAAAIFSEAVYWRAYAWKARGADYASTVSKEGWELFYERLSKAESALASSNISTGCAAPYALRLSVLTELGAQEERLASLYEEASRKHPEYHGIYFAMAMHYEPQWGGSAAKYESFANKAAEQTKAFEGMGMYARLYWLVDYHQGIPFTNDPRQAPSWKKLKLGYDDLVRLYPSSIHNIGKYAGVACRTPDSDLYRKLRTKIAGYEQSAQMVDPVDVCDRRHQWGTSKE
ncbi:DUF4034 domain-containing protein [Pseudomonas sp. PDM16]|uniref:DUF4034 domain-containing protein n=1 Tax=Pseudomonas sp. PDM16 TaxID=2769292 RepID=UPI00177D1D84|nr:DUF4034 domain-containing protein [Pseudomonas sp. PDM16]MBD9416736.1 DUF4034 domain-containing protein [Pseudomonas sp. PDM16]